MDIGKLILTDAGLDAYENGAWVKDLVGGGDMELKVSAYQSIAVQKAVAAEFEAARKENKDGAELAPDQRAAAMRVALAKSAFHDWRGVTSDGKDVPFNRDWAIAEARTQKSKKLFDLVYQASAMVEENANAFVEAASKN